MKDSRNIIVLVLQCHLALSYIILSRMHGFPELISGILGCNCLSLGCMLGTSVIESDLPSFPEPCQKPSEKLILSGMRCIAGMCMGLMLKRGIMLGFLSGAPFFF